MFLKRKQRVLVGMSGGVDSSVTAALLKKRGFDVIGFTMQLLPKEAASQSACCNLHAISDAKRVAIKLGIPHYTLNLRDPFQEHVIKNFVTQYANGFTPNPCVECNRHIKFDELFKKAEELDADFISTGHYSKITYSPRAKSHRLKKAVDLNKDQSYFLYMLPSDKLGRILFPLGKYPKNEVRELARRFGLINADKADSQEICFVSQKSYREFVDSKLDDSKKQPGNILDSCGNILGQHQGLYRYTIGQRKGLGFSSSEPMYVIKINPFTNTVVVGRHGELKIKTITLNHFVLGDQNETVVNKTFWIKTRYQMTATPCKVISRNDSDAIIEMKIAQEYISPGQSGVIYDRDRVVGGGIISEVNG